MRHKRVKRGKQTEIKGNEIYNIVKVNIFHKQINTTTTN